MSTQPGDEAYALCERMFCLALLPEGTDVIQRVTARYIELRDGAAPLPEGWAVE